MRKIAATYIFTPDQTFKKNLVLVCDNNGTILEIIENKENKELPGMEFYSGILVPGFVNVHCHLELSNLKGKIEEKKGLGYFIGEINRLRNSETENPETAMRVADRKMWASGIAAVGDISNTIRSIPAKLKSKIYYHTFVESFGFHPGRAEKSFDYAKFVWEEFRENGLSASIVPHSAYSVSELLFKKISENAITEKSILLVHNTFTNKVDLENLKNTRSLENCYFALCPNSNIYIENHLPPVNMFRTENLNICIGTDSLASNYELSILAEMLTIQQHFPETELSELLSWACINGAKALGIEKTFGSFETGKNPGVNLITGIDFKNLKLTVNSKVKRLI